MLERSHVCLVAGMALLSACAMPAQEPPAVAVVPARVAPSPPAKEETSRLEEAKALLAQAETDIQRARAKRALWLKAWEDLLAARRAMAANDPPTVIRHAKRASELAQLGLEHLAYPAVK